MDRRSFITGSACTALSVAVLPVSAFGQALWVNDVKDMLNSCVDTFKLHDFVDDRFDIFRECIHCLLKNWGNYKPLEQMMLVELDGTVRPINMYKDPNIIGEMIFLGLSNGFTLTFLSPDADTIRVNYDHDNNEFNLVIGERT